MSGYHPPAVGRKVQILSRSDRKTSVKVELSAKKNLFLETGWYRPRKWIPVCEKGFLIRRNYEI